MNAKEQKKREHKQAMLNHLASKKEVLKLDKKGRRYVHQLTGKKFERVSDVINTGLPLYSGIDEDVLAARAEVGTAVHHQIEKLSRKETSSYTTDEIEGYVSGWCLFVADFGFRPLLIEHALYDDVRLIAGRPDAIGIFEGTVGAVQNGGFMIPDYTIGASQMRKAIQTAAYKQLFLRAVKQGQFPDIDSNVRLYRRLQIVRLAVQLKSSGRYSVHIFDDDADLAAFDALLTWHRWKRRKGII